MQITSSSVGINAIQVENGPIKVLRTHMMLSTFGIVNEKEAGTMTHAHTFGGKYVTPASLQQDGSLHFLLKSSLHQYS